MLKILILSGFWLFVIGIIIRTFWEVICIIYPRQRRKLRLIFRKKKKTIKFLTTVYVIWTFTGIIGMLIIQL